MIQQNYFQIYIYLNFDFNKIVLSV